MSQIFQNFCAWIMIFINSVTEAHQSKRVAFILRPINPIRNVFNILNLFQHIQARLIRSSMHGPSQTCNSSGDTCIRVRQTRPSDSDCRRTRVLSVIRVDHEDYVHCFGNCFVYFKAFRRGGRVVE